MFGSGLFISDLEPAAAGPRWVPSIDKRACFPCGSSAWKCAPGLAFSTRDKISTGNENNVLQVAEQDARAENVTGLGFSAFAILSQPT